VPKRATTSGLYRLAEAEPDAATPDPGAMSSQGASLLRAAMAWPAALLLLLLCGVAHAQPRASVPPGCGSDAELREGLRRLIGDAADTLAARVEIAASDEAGLFTLEREAWGAVLALHYMPRIETRASSGRGVGVYAFGGRALGLLVPARFMRLGAGVEVAFQHGTGLGSAKPLSDDAWLLAGVAEIAAVPLRLGHARLELALAAQWNMLRPRFEILGYGEVYRVAIVGGSGLIRLGWTFF
jgi:hypothetical protein